MTSNISIFVATPAYGGQIYAGYFTSILKLERLCKERGIAIEYEVCYNESLIPRARNTLVHTFLQSTKFTHLLFLDADIEFDPEDVLRMLAVDQPVVGGMYPKKKVDWARIAKYVNENKGAVKEFTPELLKLVGKEPVTILLKEGDLDINKDLVEVRYLGTGIMLVQRGVFEEMMQKHPTDVYDCMGTHYFRFFDTELKYGVYLSEDYWFCDRWREMGGQIFLVPNFRCRHWGVYAYE
jgi:hypothetical protein